MNSPGSPPHRRCKEPGETAPHTGPSPAGGESHPKPGRGTYFCLWPRGERVSIYIGSRSARRVFFADNAQRMSYKLFRDFRIPLREESCGLAGGASPLRSLEAETATGTALPPQVETESRPCMTF
jgi:hypothetical protein